MYTALMCFTKSLSSWYGTTVGLSLAYTAIKVKHFVGNTSLKVIISCMDSIASEYESIGIEH
jgi:hypothetical protein